MTDELNERLAKAVGFIPCDCVSIHAPARGATGERVSNG